MTRPSWLVPLLLALLSGCRTDSTGADTRRYPCARDEECATGFVCRANTCQAPLTPPVPPPPEDAGEPNPPGSDGGTPAPDGGGTDAGTPGDTDGGSGVVPTRLGFITSPQNLVAGVCSAAVTVELQTSQGGGVPANSPVTAALSAQPSSGTTFYLDASCTSVTSSATVAAGASRATFYFRATQVPSVRLTATAASLTPAWQDETVRAGEPAGLAFLTSAQTLNAGECSSRVDLELRDAYQNPAFSSSPRGVTPSGSGVYFYSDATCDTALFEVTFAAGSTRSSFYFRGRPGSPVRVLVGGTGLSTASQDQTVRTLQSRVRTGTCEMPYSDTTVSCSISAQVDPSKTMLFYQALAAAPYAAASSVRCAFSSTSSSTSTIVCSRGQSTNSDVRSTLITWRTVEMASGLKVQHLPVVNRCFSTISQVNLSLPNAVNPDRAFVLVGSETSNSGLLDGDDFFTAKLASSTQATLRFSSNCSQSWKGWIQVVEMDGARVTRGTRSLVSGSLSGTESNLSPVDPTTSALLFTYRVSNTSNNRLCDRMLRGELSSGTSLSFSRGSDNPYCSGTNIDEIAWERIDFGPLALVQNKFLEFSSGARFPSPTPTLTAVDTSRTVAFSSAQALNGQAAGETSYGSPSDLYICEALASFSFSSSTATTLGSQRLSDCIDGRLRMNVAVVQFEP